MVKHLFEWIRAFVIAVLILIILNFFIGTTAVFHSSMVPTLSQGDTLLVWKLGKVDRGDIVIFDTSLPVTERDLEGIDPLRRLLTKLWGNKILIKRIVGLPGESVSIQGGKVYIDGKLLDESKYLSVDTPGDLTIERIPPGEYFLMGDNRANSMDSRDESVGLVRREAIKGKVLLRYWPISEFQFF